MAGLVLISERFISKEHGFDTLISDRKKMAKFV